MPNGRDTHPQPNGQRFLGQTEAFSDAFDGDRRHGASVTAGRGRASRFGGLGCLGLSTVLSFRASHESPPLKPPAPVKLGLPSRTWTQTVALIALAAIPVLVFALAGLASLQTPSTDFRRALPDDLEALAMAMATGELSGHIDIARLRDVTPQRARVWRRVVSRLAELCHERPPELLALLTVGYDEINLHGDPIGFIGVANGLTVLATAEFRRSPRGRCTPVMIAWIEQIKATPRPERPLPYRGDG